MKKIIQYILAVLSLGLVLVACASPASNSSSEDNNPPPSSNTSTQTLLVLTDSVSGNIYEFDPQTKKQSARLITVGDSAGEIYIDGDYAIVADGFTNQGLHRFSLQSPTSYTSSSQSFSAQYFARVTANKVYVTSYGNGLWYFNPATLEVTQIADAIINTKSNLQGIVLASDNLLYITDQNNNKVLRYNPSTDSLVKTIDALGTGTTGIIAASYMGKSGVFVANNGGYGTTYTPSLSFIATDADQTQLITTSIVPNGLALLSPSLLVVSGGGKTYLVNIASDPVTITEVKSGDTSFAGAVKVYNGRAYVVDSDYSARKSTLYIFDSSGSPSVESYTVGETGVDSITNIAIYTYTVD